jgi:hypothetical protein
VKIKGAPRLGERPVFACLQRMIRLEGIGSGRDPTEIAALFDADLVFEVQGDDGVLPWIGRKTGPALGRFQNPTERGPR